MSGGALDASVTLDDVFTVVGAKRVPLAPELAGYLVLEMAEHADPDGGAVDAKSVYVGEEGTVALVKPRRTGSLGDAEASIRAALARLLDVSGSKTAALAAASKRPSGAGLPALAAELEAALIPVNRAAGRRALARLAREVKRVTLGVGRNAPPSSPHALEPPPARSPSARAAAAARFAREEEPTTARGQIPAEVLQPEAPAPAESSELPTMQFEPAGRTPSPSQADVDALIAGFGVSADSNERQHARDLKAIAGLDPTPPPPQGVRRIDTREIATGHDSDVEALLALGGPGRDDAGGRDARPVAEPAGTVRAPSPSLAERQMPTQPSKLRQMRASMPSAQVARRSHKSVAAWLVGLAVLGAGAFAALRLRPTTPPPAPAAPAAPAPAAPSVVVSGPVPCADIIVVADVPAHAEVLVRKGQAPVDVERMPVGARLEFVATADGYSPKRVVVPTGAAWDTGPDGKPRYEAAVQLDKSHAPKGSADPWPAGEPGSAVGGQGPPGTVHVVSTPRGAEVWMLAGLGPDARIEQQLSCTEDVDVLLAGPTTFRKRLHVAASDFVAEEGPNAQPASPGKSPRRIAHISGK